MALYAIPCNFQITQDSPVIEGMAICTDPDTPVVFIQPNGEVYPGLEMWTYRLKHFMPWAKVLD